MDFVAFDLETTGVKAADNKIIEVGAVKFVDGKAFDTFGTLVDPQESIPYDATAVNGITNDMVKGKPVIDAVLNDFTCFCGDLPLVAHNAPFDYKFLLQDIEALQAPAPSGVVLDTLPLARNLFPGLYNYKLVTLVRHFELPSGTFHRAEEDSAYCGMVFIEVLKKLKHFEKDVSIESIVRLTGRKELRFPQYNDPSDQLTLF